MHRCSSKQFTMPCLQKLSKASVVFLLKTLNSALHSFEILLHSLRKHTKAFAAVLLELARQFLLYPPVSYPVLFLKRKNSNPD